MRFVPQRGHPLQGGPRFAERSEHLVGSALLEICRHFVFVADVSPSPHKNL